MFSVVGDTVLDPYLGTGTTMVAAIASGRNSIGIEIDSNFKKILFSRFKDVVQFSNELIRKRINKHLDFVQERTKTKGELKYKNKFYGFPVLSSQEIDMNFYSIEEIKQVEENYFEVTYVILPQDFKSQDLPLFRQTLSHNILS